MTESYFVSGISSVHKRILVVPGVDARQQVKHDCMYVPSLISRWNIAECDIKLQGTILAS